ncbi:MAG: V-type ATP synthase subunit K [Clostridia bacterium]|nr:V-type ATP synthase subunit K [Clostridia bacterium]
MDFLTTNFGVIFAWVAVALAVFLPGMGSAKGVGIVGQAGAGLLSEDPSKFSKVLILVILPGTQGLYGFLTGILIMNSAGLMGGAAELSVATGLQFVAAALPIAIVGYFSAIAQAKAAAAGVGITAKHPEKSTNGVVLSAMVETYAVLALLISLLSIFNIQVA